MTSLNFCPFTFLFYWVLFFLNERSLSKSQRKGKCKHVFRKENQILSKPSISISGLPHIHPPSLRLLNTTKLVCLPANKWDLGKDYCWQMIPKIWDGVLKSSQLQRERERAASEKLSTCQNCQGRFPEYKNVNAGTEDFSRKMSRTVEFELISAKWRNVSIYTFKSASKHLPLNF